jgi:uncharacterized protein (TIGR02284 family)
MDGSKEAVISTLNKLIQVLKDGENGFREAAEGVRDDQLKSLFSRYSQERAQMASDLRAAVRNLGGDPEQGGRVAAALHRGWMNIKVAVTNHDEAAIISECERGEDNAKHSYQEALETDLPADTKRIIQEQYFKVKEVHDRVRSMEKAAQR